MLRLFHSQHPLFPVRWANAVTSWLLGLRSNSGSLTINNTATPGNGDGPSIDVNLAWAKALIASETPRPETERVTEDLVPPEEWNTDDGTGYGDKETKTGEDSDGNSFEGTYYPCCGKNILPAAADHRHKSNIAPTDEVVGGGYSAEGDVGSSVYAARFDHKHPYPTADEVVADDGGGVEMTVQAALEDHNTRIEALENESACDCATKWEEQYAYDQAQDDDIVTAYETAEAAQTDATAAKTKVDAITVGDGADAKVPLTALTGNIDGHSGTCYVTINNDGSLGHSLNGAYNLLEAARTSGGAKLLTDADLTQDEINTLKQAAEDIDTLQTTADEAKAAADEAKTTAEAAQTAATEAKTTADAANTAAADAQSKVDAVTVKVGDEVRVPLNKLTGNIAGHSGDCYVTIDNDGNLGHSGNNAYTMLNTASQASGATKLLTDADLSSDDITTLTDLAEAATDGVTQTITLCTGISWEYVTSAGAKALVFTTQQLTFTKGLLTEVGTAKKTYNEYDGG